MAKLRRGAEASELDAYLADLQQQARERNNEAIGGQRQQGVPLTNGARPPAEPAAPRYVALCMNQVQRKPIEWLWPDKLAYGKLSLVVGDGDLGKSWAMLDVAARLSTATPLPGHEERPERCSTVLLMGEDDAADTIGPRLDAQRADSGRIWLMEGVKRGAGTAVVRLQRDLEQVERLLRDKGARFLVIDPLASYLAGTDGINEIEVRSALLPVSDMAQRIGTAVIAIMHRNKGEHRNPINAIGGSVAFGNIARCVLAVAADPVSKGRRCLVPIKGNILKTQEAIGYRIAEGVLSWDDEPVELTRETVFADHRPSTAGTDDDDGSKLGQAKVFLRTVLEHQGGRCPQRKLMADALADGLKEKTVRRAKKDLGLEEELVYGEGGHSWHWLLPNGHQEDA